MTLNLSTGGDFTPFIKYNAKAGRWFVRNEAGNDVEVPNPRFAIDMENIKTGWIHFSQTGAPEFVWDVNGERQARPGNQYKDGFEVDLYGADKVETIGTNVGWRQWTSNAGAAKTAMLKIYTEWENAKQPGKLPIFQCTGITVIPSQYGDNYEPNFVLQSWVEREQLPGKPVPTPQPKEPNPTMPPVGGIDEFGPKPPPIEKNPFEAG